MAAVFDPAVFQNNVFQVGDVVEAPAAIRITARTGGAARSARTGGAGKTARTRGS